MSFGSFLRNRTSPEVGYGGPTPPAPTASQEPVPVRSRAGRTPQNQPRQDGKYQGRREMVTAATPLGIGVSGNKLARAEDVRGPLAWVASRDPGVSMRDLAGQSGLSLSAISRHLGKAEVHRQNVVSSQVDPMVDKRPGKSWVRTHTPQEENAALYMLKEGENFAEVAAWTGINGRTLGKVAAEHNQVLPPRPGRGRPPLGYQGRGWAPPGMAVSRRPPRPQPPGSPQEGRFMGGHNARSR